MGLSRYETKPSGSISISNHTLVDRVMINEQVKIRWNSPKLRLPLRVLAWSPRAHLINCEQEYIGKTFKCKIFVVKFE